jgi:hypothetical protein
MIAFKGWRDGTGLQIAPYQKQQSVQPGEEPEQNGNLSFLSAVAIQAGQIHAILVGDHFPGRLQGAPFAVDALFPGEPFRLWCRACIAPRP